MMLFKDNNLRSFTPEELNAEKNAILWLLKERVEPRKIRLLQIRDLDREERRIRVAYETRVFTIVRAIPYENTPLEKWIEILDRLVNSRIFIFPKGASKSGRANFLGAYSEDEFYQLVYGESQKISTKKVLNVSFEKRKIVINR